ncbi:MAG: hypothetical protein JO321_16710 [Solirubrobacterales bacterium]|nr:hypothetical protein [Solirubrobacterales bacterium]
MSESKASRRLVKSPPELWSEVSNAASLQRHLAQFGDIRITKLESESAVAWEGEHARGTIRLEPSGWGTRVSLTAEPIGVGSNGPAPGQGGADVESAPPQLGTEERSGRESDVGRRPWPTRLAHKVRRWLNPQPRDDHERVEAQDVSTAAAGAAVAAVEPEPEAAADASPTAQAKTEPPAGEVALATTVALNAALDSLGRAHHRPYSRA